MHDVPQTANLDNGIKKSHGSGYRASSFQMLGNVAPFTFVLIKRDNLLLKIHTPTLLVKQRISEIHFGLSEICIRKAQI